MRAESETIEIDHDPVRNPDAGASAGRADTRSRRCSPRHALGILLGIAPALCGCTSLTWQDSNGVRHHLGLVAVRIEERGGSQLVQKRVLGVDLDLSDDGGYTLGAAATEFVRPDERHPQDYDGFIDSYRAFTTGRDLSQKTPVVHWHLFYAKEPDSSSAVIVRRQCAGFGLNWGEATHGLDVGWADCNQVLTGHLGSSSVLCAVSANGDPAQYRLWKLAPD